MKVLSLKNVEDMKHDPIPFEGEWYQAFGRPERSGIWIIYGKSGQGKTHFSLLMAREFDRMGFRTMFIPLEMGYSKDFKEEIWEAGIRSGISKIILSDSCDGIKDLDEYLSRQRSPDVIFIDSIQYFVAQCGVRAEDVIALRKKYRSKIFIFISHVDGREVDGRVAYDVKRDSFKRIYIDKFKATYMGRGKGGPKGYYIIWEEGYQKMNLELLKDNAYEDNDYPGNQ